MKNPMPEIILASRSAGRKEMLSRVNMKYTCLPADIDEDSLQNTLLGEGYSAPDITAQLAQGKAKHISAGHPNALVIGSDQTLIFEGEIYSKAANRDAARAKLSRLRGHTHTLCSSVCVARNSEIIFSYTEDAHLTMHDFDDSFLDLYIEQADDALTHCVGAYKTEGLGACLFSEIKGDTYTILGMPLLPLLGFLREQHGWVPCP